jgi:lysozyme family protein
LWIVVGSIVAVCLSSPLLYRVILYRVIRAAVNAGMRDHEKWLQKSRVAQ